MGLVQPPPSYGLPISLNIQKYLKGWYDLNLIDLHAGVITTSWGIAKAKGRILLLGAWKEWTGVIEL